MYGEYAESIKRLNAEMADAFALQHKQLSIIGAFAQNYLHSVYIDLKTGKFEEIKGLPFASEAVGKKGDAQRAAEIAIRTMAAPESQAALKKFLDFATLEERLSAASALSCDYLSTYLGWCRAHFFVAGRGKDGSPLGVVYAVESIAGERQREKEIAQKMEGFAQKVFLDPLTGTYNRLYFDENKVSLATFFAVAMLDLDDFKKINADFGSRFGDQVLAEVAKAVSGRLRSYDVLIRYSQDEFIAAFLTGPDFEVVKRLEAIRADVEALSFPAHPGLKITASLGCAFRSSAADMFLMADKMLYRAKLKKNTVAM